MFWTKKDLPINLQQKPDHIVSVGLTAANTALLKGLSTDEATFACTQAIKQLERGSRPTPEPRKVPEHIKQLLIKQKAPDQPKVVFNKAFLGDNALPADQERTVVNAEFDNNNRLVILFDTGEKIVTKPIDITQNIEQYLSVSNTTTGSELPLEYSHIQFDVANPTSPVDVGMLTWNDTDGTLDLGLKGGNVTLQIGQEQVVRFVNHTDFDFAEMQVVRILGAQGNRLSAALAQSNSEVNSNTTFAVVTEPILKNQQGYATVSGLVRNIDTSAFAEGAVLYLSPFIAGGITSTIPVSPNRNVRVGYCVRSHATVGSIFVNIINDPELSELPDVLVQTPQNNEVLMYESSTGLWKNKAITAEGDEVQAKRVDFVGEDVIYKAEAAVGTLNAASVWRIRKILIAVDGDVSETWASGNAGYDKVWDDRLTYTYS